MSPDRQIEPRHSAQTYPPSEASPEEARLPAELPVPEQHKKGTDALETLPPGRMLGTFRVLQHIGSGGMGQVYRAVDKRLNREVAIKILPLVYARELDLVSRFQAEARAASSLNHPNIVAIHDIGREGDLCWIVSELVDGQSLRALIESGPIKSRRVIEIGSQIAEGLAAAHAGGLIHRDLKPENIMITRENRVKILDFGLAKSSTPSAIGPANTTVTQIGEVLGTPGYMSPEQVAGGPIDQRSDIFSLGVILYEMLTHERPFTGANRVSVMHATLMEDPPPVLSPELARITARCLEKQPQRRFQSAADAAFALQMVSGSTSQTLIAPLSRRRPWRKWVLLAGACVLAGAGLFWIGLKARPAQPPLQGTMRQLTWDDALTTGAAISPDGRLVAYASDRANGRDLNIYVQQIDGGGTLQLTNDGEANDEPTFSPDGSQIAFHSRRGYGGVYEVPAIGGDRHLIAAGGRHPRFSPDGQLMLYARVGSEASFFGGWGAELFVQPLAGGAPVLITRACSHVVAEAVWSPDSRHILATATCGGKLGLWLIDRDGATIRQTNGGQLWDDQHLNLPHGLTFQNLDQWLTNPPRVMLPLMQGDAQYEVTMAISSDGLKFSGSPERLNFGPGRTIHGSMSANGRIALTASEQFSNLWELPIDLAGHATGKPFQITRSRAPLIQQTLSRDGRTLAFVVVACGTRRTAGLESGEPVCHAGDNSDWVDPASRLQPGRVQDQLRNRPRRPRDRYSWRGGRRHLPQRGRLCERLVIRRPRIPVDWPHTRSTGHCGGGPGNLETDACLERSRLQLVPGALLAESKIHHFQRHAEPAFPHLCRSAANGIGSRRRLDSPYERRHLGRQAAPLRRRQAPVLRFRSRRVPLYLGSTAFARHASHRYA
jgi:hypothetical protein